LFIRAYNAYNENNSITAENSHLSRASLALILSFTSSSHYDISTFSSYFGHHSNFLWAIYHFKETPSRHLSKTMSIKSRNWDQLSRAAELPKRFSINPRGSDKCEYIGRVVAVRTSFASPTEKFLVRLISVVNACRSQPREPNEDGRAIYFATRSWQIEFHAFDQNYSFRGHLSFCYSGDFTFINIKSRSTKKDFLTLVDILQE